MTPFELPEAPPELLPYLSIIGGVILLIAGRFLYHIALWVMGAVIGAGIAVILVDLMPDESAIFEAISLNVVTVSAAALGAVAGGFLFHYLQLFAFFLAGSAVGVWGMTFLWRTQPELLSGLSPDSDLSYAIALPLVALATGLLCVAMNKWVVIALTSALGGILIAEGLKLPATPLAAVAIAVLGFIIQGVIFERMLMKKRWKRVEE